MRHRSWCSATNALGKETQRAGIGQRGIAMVFLPVSHVTLRRREDSRLPRLSAIVSWGAEFFGIFGAARRAAAAVEAGHDPDPVDLRTLGINRKLPKVR